MTDDNIQLFTVNGRKPSARLPVRRYAAMREAIHRALADQPQGLTFQELAVAAAPLLPQWWTDERWDEMWHATNVKLHLEYLGELERVPGAKPHRVRLAGAGAGAWPAPAVGRASAAPARAKPKSPREMGAAMAANLPERTGRSLADWIKLVRATGLTDWKEAKQWLKDNHGLTTMYAYMVAGAALAGPADYGDADGLLAALYSGPRELLRPIHEQLWALAQGLGPEVELVVCKTYCSFRANSQFAVVKPTTQTAVDLGLALPPDTPCAGRLVEAKNLGGGERNKHRIRLENVKQIDAEVQRWLKAAYAWDLKRKAR